MNLYQILRKYFLYNRATSRLCLWIQKSRSQHFPKMVKTAEAAQRRFGVKFYLWLYSVICRKYLSKNEVVRIWVRSIADVRQTSLRVHCPRTTRHGRIGIFVQTATSSAGAYNICRSVTLRLHPAASVPSIKKNIKNTHRCKAANYSLPLRRTDGI